MAALSTYLGSIPIQGTDPIYVPAQTPIELVDQETPLMINDPTTTPFLESGWYISYMNYGATGEGVTSCIAVAGNAEYAENILKEKLHEFFHQLIVTAPIDATASDDAQMMIKWIPEAAKEILRQLPRSAGHYFTELHYNLS